MCTFRVIGRYCRCSSVRKISSPGQANPSEWSQMTATTKCQPDRTKLQSSRKGTQRNKPNAQVPFKPIEKQPRLLALQNLQATLKQPRFPSSHMHARTQTLEDTQAAAKPQLCKHKGKEKVSFLAIINITDSDTRGLL